MDYDSHLVWSTNLFMQQLLRFSLGRCAVDPFIFRHMSPGKKEVNLIVSVLC